MFSAAALQNLYDQVGRPPRRRLRGRHAQRGHYLKQALANLVKAPQVAHELHDGIYQPAGAPQWHQLWHELPAGEDIHQCKVPTAR